MSPAETRPSEPPSAARRARAFVVLMGVVAMFGDMTYEGARGLVGPWLALLGASATAIGFAAGLGELLGYGLRLVTGWLSDRTRAYWPLVIGGYAVNLVAVPGLALAGSWEAAAALLLLERVGKAIRSPARSTLISYASSEASLGARFGLEEALDQLGAVIGPLLTALAMWVVRGEPAPARFRAAFLVLLLPIALNLAFVLRARARYPTPEALQAGAPPAALHPGSLFRWYVAGAMLLALGFSDWALVALHASRAGLLEASALPVLYAGAMAVDAVGALVFGWLFDRVGVAVLAGAAVLSAAIAPLVFGATSLGGLAAGAAVWALVMGAQDSVLKAAIAKLVPKAERGRAYGVFFALFGLAWWLGSAAMGWLYDRSPGLLVAFSSAAQLAAAPILLGVGLRVRAREAAR